MPTLKELFKTKELPSQGGKTAEEAYDIQNSKDIRISTSDPLVNNTGFAAARLLRKGLGVRGSETLLEEEVVGVRIIRGLSIPVIYGSDLPRLTLRTTPLLDVMKAGANGTEGDGGLIGGAISDARNFVNDKLGIPSNIIPTKVVGDDRISSKGETQNRMIDLADIRKSGEGSLLGKFLKDGGGGNLKTIGKQAIGGAINLAKDKIRGKLFGERSTTGFNNAGSNEDGSNITVNYGSLDSEVGVTIKTSKETGVRDVGGLMYSKTFNLTFRDDDETGKLNFIDSTDEGGLARKTPNVVLSKFNLPSYDGLKAGDTFPLYSKLFLNVKPNDVRDSIDSEGKLIKKTDKLTFPTKSEAVSEGEEDSVQSNTSDSIPYEPNTSLHSELFNTLKQNTIEGSVNNDGTLKETEKTGFKTIKEAIDEGEEDSTIFGENGTQKFPDKLELTIERNRISPIVERDEKITLLKLGIETTKDTINQLAIGNESEDDYAPLIFKAVGGDSIQFRATIDGLTETFSPSWDSNKFAGNPFSYHTYTGIERSVGFNFKIFSLNLDEHKIAWDKLNELTGLVYPLGYNSNSSIKPPFLQFTLGDLYKKKYSFIDSLSYTFDDTTPWEIDEKGYRLPTMISVSIGLKFLETRGNTSGKKFYSLKPTTA
jgi:hypothetical protein